MEPMRQLLLGAMVFYVFYMFALGVLNFRTRFLAIRKREVHFKFFTTYTGDAPEWVIRMGRHYDNQFQLPLLFFAAGVLNSTLPNVNYVSVGLAWFFVLARMAHTFVHLGGNYLPARAGTFFLGWVAIVLMWGQIGMIALGW